MAHARSLLFAVYWAAWTTLFLVPLAIFLLSGSPQRPIRRATRLWARGILGGLRRIVGLRYVEEGRQHLPAEPCLIVANHQSTWETLAFLVLVPDVAIVAKQELLAIPVVGWFLRRSPMIVIDRANGTQALRTMIDGGREAVAAGRSVLIFPEGTRGGIDAPLRFKRGVELLYGRLGLPVVPVALNSGLYWPGGTATRSGTVVVSYLAAVAPGLPAAEFLRGTEAAIDRELNRWRDAGAAELSATGG